MVKLDLNFMKNMPKVSPKAGKARNEPIFNMGIWNFKLNSGIKILVKTKRVKNTVVIFDALWFDEIFGSNLPKYSNGAEK